MTGEREASSAAALDEQAWRDEASSVRASTGRIWCLHIFARRYVEIGCGESFPFSSRHGAELWT